MQSLPDRPTVGRLVLSPY